MRHLSLASLGCRARWDVPPVPERRLAMAILEDALRTLGRSHSPTGISRRLLREVREWVEESDTSWPFSFVNVCETLSVDPERLREALTPWLRRPNDYDVLPYGPFFR